MRERFDCFVCFLVIIVLMFEDSLKISKEMIMDRRMEQILSTVANRCEVTISDIQSTGRYDSVSFARALISYLALKHTPFQSPMIGLVMNKNAAAVRLGNKRINHLVAQDEKTPLFDGEKKNVGEFIREIEIELSFTSDEKTVSCPS